MRAVAAMLVMAAIALIACVWPMLVALLPLALAEVVQGWLARRRARQAMAAAWDQLPPMHFNCRCIAVPLDVVGEAQPVTRSVNGVTRYPLRGVRASRNVTP